jgi:hypothetical protein
MSLHDRSHESAAPPAASAALGQRLLRSAASRTNQAPIALTAALLFSVHDCAPPTGPPVDRHRAGHELARSLPRGRRPGSRQRGSRAAAPPVGSEQDQPSPHRPDRRRRPFVFGPRLRWAASGSRACTLAVVIMHITGAMVGPFGACSGLATRTGREKPALFFLAVAAYAVASPQKPQSLKPLPFFRRGCGLILCSAHASSSGILSALLPGWRGLPRIAPSRSNLLLKHTRQAF